MRTTVLAALFLAIQTFSGRAFGADLRSAAPCPAGFLADQLVSERRNSPEVLLDDLVHIDAEISALRVEIPKRGGSETAALSARLATQEAEAAALLHRLDGTMGETPKEVATRRELSDDIVKLRAQIEKTKADLEVAAKRASAPPVSRKSQPGLSQPPAPTPMAQVQSLEQLAPSVRYDVPGGVGANRQVVFMDGVLEELLGKNYGPREREVFLQAMKNGVVGEKGSRGIKIMKTSEGITFAEVKSIGGFEARIFGCVEGAMIVLHFVGTDMKGGGRDPQRDRLKRLCK